MGRQSETPAQGNTTCSSRAACQRGTADAIPASGETNGMCGRNRCLMGALGFVLMVMQGTSLRVAIRRWCLPKEATRTPSWGNACITFKANPGGARKPVVGFHPWG